MIHIENKTVVDPEVIEKGSFLLTFTFSFLLLANSHAFSNSSLAALGRSTFHKIEAKASYLRDLGLTEDVAQKRSQKDLDNSYSY